MGDVVPFAKPYGSKTLDSIDRGLDEFSRLNEQREVPDELADSFVEAAHEIGELYSCTQAEFSEKMLSIKERIKTWPDD